MGVVAVMLLAWGLMVKPCTSVVVHDRDIDSVPFPSDMCGAYHHEGSTNMSRHSMASLHSMCASVWPLDGLVEKALESVIPEAIGTLTLGFVTPKKIAEAVSGMTGGIVGSSGKANEDKALSDISNIFGGISKVMPESLTEALDSAAKLAEKTGVVKKKVGGVSALEVADEYVGKITILVDNVKSCCKHHPNLPGSLKCNTFLTGFQQVAMGFHEAVLAYFKDLAMPENWKDGVCKLFSMETAVKPIQDAATSVMKLFEKLDDTCIMPSPGQATELMKSMARIGGVPKEIIDGEAKAKDDLKKNVCKIFRGRRVVRS